MKEPGKPMAGTICEFCDRQAKIGTEILRNKRGAVYKTGRFIYTCDQHVELALSTFTKTYHGERTVIV